MTAEDALHFLYLVGTSSVVGVVVAQVGQFVRDRQIRATTGKHDALRAAVLLEGFAIRCAIAIEDHDTAVQSDGKGGKYMGAVPDLPDLTTTIGALVPVTADIANRVAVFPQVVEQAAQVAGFFWDFVGDIEATREAAAQESAKVGLEAIAIAQALRTHFKLPSRTMTFGNWNISQRLQDAVE